MLNLGCGSRLHPDWNNLDHSPLVWLAQHPLAATLATRLGLISKQRRSWMAEIRPDVLHWDFARGIPFPDATFDVIYHSHVLEHLSRPRAREFLRECHRVLAPGGVARIVVPDLRQLVAEYNAAVAALAAGERRADERQEQAIAGIFEQIVRDEPSALRHRRGPAARAERLVRGDPRRTGEVHRWMYDADSLCRLLAACTFVDCQQVDHETSRIPEWSRFGLDQNEDGSPHIPKSLYVEASRV